MANYLGEFPVCVLDVEGGGSLVAAIRYIGKYGQIDGAHHKAWVLDQVSRILHGTPVHVTAARWDDGSEEYRYNTGEPSEHYLTWVEKMRGEQDEDGEYEYDYDEGIAP